MDSGLDFQGLRHVLVTSSKEWIESTLGLSPKRDIPAVVSSMHMPMYNYNQHLTLPETNSSPLKIGRNPKGKLYLPTISFWGELLVSGRVVGLLIIDPKLPNKKQLNVVNHPRHPVIFSNDDWGVKSPPPNNI